MNDFKIRSIGLRKAKGIIGLVNLVYNMCRYEQIIRLNLLSIKKLIIVVYYRQTSKDIKQ